MSTIKSIVDIMNGSEEDSKVNAQEGTESGEDIMDDTQENLEEQEPEEASSTQICVECESQSLNIRSSGLIICNDCNHIDRSGLEVL